jgi:hypothetical protein
VLDINGGELREGGLAQLLCEVVAIGDDGVRLRVLNSDMDLYVGAKHDEVLGGLVADSELTAFVEAPPTPAPAQSDADGVAISAFE